MSIREMIRNANGLNKLAGKQQPWCLINMLDNKALANIEKLKEYEGKGTAVIDFIKNKKKNAKAVVATNDEKANYVPMAGSSRFDAQCLANIENPVEKTAITKLVYDLDHSSKVAQHLSSIQLQSVFVYKYTISNNAVFVATSVVNGVTGPVVLVHNLQNKRNWLYQGSEAAPWLAATKTQQASAPTPTQTDSAPIPDVQMPEPKFKYFEVPADMSNDDKKLVEWAEKILIDQKLDKKAKDLDAKFTVCNNDANTLIFAARTKHSEVVNVIIDRLAHKVNLTYATPLIDIALKQGENLNTMVADQKYFGMQTMMVQNANPQLLSVIDVAAKLISRHEDFMGIVTSMTKEKLPQFTSVFSNDGSQLYFTTQDKEKVLYQVCVNIEKGCITTAGVVITKLDIGSCVHPESTKKDNKKAA